MSQTYPTFGRSLVILHVDDDPMNLRVVEEILTAFHHTAIKASSGPEALQRLAEQAFDVVLMDIHMPGMSGIETVAAIRGLPGPQRELPVIALTADVLSRHPSEYPALGFDDFVSKPILVAGLLEAIKRAAEPEPAASRKSANAA
ncbi:response regulator [Phenylobacterium sp.]|uniref:response regulator n=1 Tax=Phenylobacterium sp. TaxID=1871053 RepID=UPI00374CF3DD